MAAMAANLDWMIAVLAQDGPRQTGPDFGKASPFGLIVVVLLLIGTFGLVWSMNRHLRRLPESFDTEASAEADRTGVDPDITVEPPVDGDPR